MMHEFSFEETAYLLSAIDGSCPCPCPCSDSVNELKSAFISIIAPSKAAALAIKEMVVKLDDGSINCLEAGGWIEPADVEEVTEGMEVEIDRDWL